MDGLRERKKAATRQAISDIATRMFERRGFEHVTVAEIAEAAGVSVKTVFNYFPTKEELFFDREDEILERLLATLRERPPGTSPTAAMRPLMLGGPIPVAFECRWSQLPEVYDALRAFMACERASPTLQARRLMIAESWVAPLARESGSEAWAALFLAVMGLRHRVMTDALLERRSARTVERRVRAVVGEALDALERGFG